jgi:hypothetical protein
MLGLSDSGARHLSQPFLNASDPRRGTLTDNLLDFKYFGDIKTLNTNQQANVQNVFKVLSETGEGSKVEALLASVREEAFADDFAIITAPKMDLPLVANQAGMHLSGEVIDGPNGPLWNPTGVGKLGRNTEVDNLARMFINSEVRGYAGEQRIAMASLC